VIAFAVGMLLGFYLGMLTLALMVARSRA